MENDDFIKISFTDQGQLRVEAAAATTMIFEVDFGPADYNDAIADICGVLPALLRADVATEEMFDDAGRTQPNPIDLQIICMFKAKYGPRLAVEECDLLE